MKDIARHLGRSILHGGEIRKERELIRCVIAILTDERIRVDGRNVDARGSPGLHPLGGDTHRSELFAVSVLFRDIFAFLNIIYSLDIKTYR